VDYTQLALVLERRGKLAEERRVLYDAYFAPYMKYARMAAFRRKVGLAA
jgi:hypothetical protein